MECMALDSAGQEKYDIGSGFGHFALGVPDVAATVASIKEAGVRGRLQGQDGISTAHFINEDHQQVLLISYRSVRD